jgi:hypothetical protein
VIKGHAVAAITQRNTATAAVTDRDKTTVPATVTDRDKATVSVS